MFEVALGNGTTQAVQLTPGFSSHDGRLCESIANPFDPGYAFFFFLQIMRDMLEITQNDPLPQLIPFTIHFIYGYIYDRLAVLFTEIIVTINRSTEHLWSASFSRKIEMY